MSQPRLNLIVMLLLATLGCPSKGSSGGGTGGSSATKDGGGAGSGGSAGSAAKDAGPPPGAPTFTAIFKEVIVGTGCNGGTLCHAGTVGNLTMNNRAEAYAALVGVKAMGTNLMPGKGANCADSGLTRVVAGKPDESLMMKKIDHMQPCGDPMPPTSVSLAADKVEQIRTWIMNGAKDD